jgi:hypothetical protein
MSLGLDLGLVVKLITRHECEHRFISIALFNFSTCFLSMVAKQNKKVPFSFDRLYLAMQEHEIASKTYSTRKKHPPWISVITRAVSAKTCVYVVLSECRSAAQPVPQLHEV